MAGEFGTDDIILILILSITGIVMYIFGSRHIVNSDQYKKGYEDGYNGNNEFMSCIEKNYFGCLMEYYIQGYYAGERAKKRELEEKLK
ncbi:hypothetical protein [Methanosarcina mazei]|uniref:Uncharacterized protein n=1 Tax=Methanosarcina mazei TaxID=2209 RepID=A0A0F8H871_METMZ|nr:hypothetical protein [Methanosarcina mazei]KKG56169.1 hypothetical protein DU33_17535 [Methanosarcina mazei]KKG63023.1 hypothetical protein DU45_17560 [Methanosarcina mazei]KKG63089.1 hypothetical protein DU64_20205 [Methanosarcina mazei]